MIDTSRHFFDKEQVQANIQKKELEKSKKSDTIKAEENNVRTNVIPQQKTDTVIPRQKIHRQGTKEYVDRQVQLKQKGEYGPPYVTISDDEIIRLVNKYKGTGEINIGERSGKWDNIELIKQNDEIIGYVVNNITGKTVPTSVFKIHYSNKGVHIVPDYPSKKNK